MLNLLFFDYITIQIWTIKIPKFQILKKCLKGIKTKIRIYLKKVFVGLVNKIMTVKKYLKKSLFKENCKSYSKMLYLKTYFGHHSKNIFNFAK